MELWIRLEYGDLFDGDQPSLTSLVNNVPTKVMLALSSIINVSIINKTNQIDLLLDLLKHLDKEGSERIIHRLSHSNSMISNGFNPNTLGIFSRDICLELMCLSLNQPTAQGSEKILNNNNVLHFLKAVLVLNQKANFESSGKKVNYEKEDGFEYCKNFLWKALLKQFEYIKSPSIKYQIVRGFYFFDYVRKTKFNVYLIEFFKKKGFDNSLHYLLEITKLINHLSQTARKKGFSSFTRIDDPLNLFGSYTMNDSFIFDGDKKNISDLKKRPILRFNDNHYFIIDIDFLVAKLYESLTFDFYYNTLLKDQITFPEYRSFIGDFTQKHFFKMLFEKLLITEFNKSGSEKENSSHEGLPDFFGVNGNNLFLFEVKEVLFSEDLIQSGNVDLIEEAILKRVSKFDKPNKGSGQILRIIKKLDSGSMTIDGIWSEKLKKLKVFPVIIHSCPQLEMPEVNVLLSKRFIEKLEDCAFTKINNNNVNSPVLIHLRYFVEDYPFSSFVKNTSFRNEIKNYAKTLKKVSKTGFISKTENSIYTQPYNSFNEKIEKMHNSRSDSRFFELFFTKEMIY